MALASVSQFLTEDTVAMQVVMEVDTDIIMVDMV